MSELEMTVEALKRCVHPEAFARAMDLVRGEEQGGVHSCSQPDAEMQKVVRKLLLEVGIPTAVRGYRYAVTAICLLMENPSLADGITKCLYPETAKRHDSTATRVERAIRHGVECAFNRGDLDVLYGFFGNTVGGYSGKPTNSEFLTCMANVAQERLGR